MRRMVSAVLALVMALSLVVVGVPAAWADAPTEDGKIFAGYYTDDTYTTPSKTETSYPKFVDENVLTVKYQLIVGAAIGAANENSDSTKLRVVTTVDSLNYQEIGLKVTVGNAEPRYFTSTKVAKTITGKDGLAKLTYEPGYFSEDSQWLCAFNFNLPGSKFSTELKFEPYWVTMDGQTVYGTHEYEGNTTYRSVTISESPSFNNYLISDASQLFTFASVSQSSDFAGWKVKLTQDIDMNPGWMAGSAAPANTWTAIGSASVPFAGTFDGQGHTLSGVYQSAAGTGLFKQTAPAAVLKDFRLENSYFNTTDGIAGCIAAKFAGRAEKIYNAATLYRSNGNNYFGGFFGQTFTGAVLSECWFDGTLLLSNGQRDGGFIGAVCGNTTVEHCLFTGALTGGYAYMGGITGMVGVSGGGTAMTLTVRDTLVAALGTITANSSTGVCSLVGARETGAIEVINFDHTVAISKLQRTTAGSFGWTNSENYTSRDTYDDFMGTDPVLTLNGFLDFSDYWVRRIGGIPVPKSLLAGFYLTTVEDDKTVYTIHNISDLKAFAAMSQSTNFADCIVKLDADIDMNPGWTAGAAAPANQWTTQIGSASRPFAGTFDGQGHTLSGVYRSSGSTTYNGLFCKTAATSVLKDFRLTNSYFGTTSAYAGSVAGAFAGRAEKLYSDAIIAKTTSGNSRYGGFFGNIEGSAATLIDCWFDGAISASGNSYVGGLIGSLDTACDVTVTNCLFTGSITASQQTGGICGIAFASNSNITITETLAAGTISASQWGTLIGGRQTASSVLTANNSAGVGSTKWYGNSGAYYGNAVNVSSKTLNQLTGLNGLFLDTWLDFENVWQVRDGDVPVLACFTDSGEANTFLIQTAGGLLEFASATQSNSFAGWTIKLGADIDLNEGWTAGATAPATKWNAKIGTDSYPFAGTFDGQGHTVRGVYQSASGARAGFFGVTASTAVVENFRLENSYFTSTNNQVGSIVGSASGLLRNIYSNASVTGKGWAGGLVGLASGVTVENAWFDGIVTTTSPSTQGIGGIIAIAYSGANAVRNCLNSGTINVEQFTGDCPRVGGIVGYATQEGTTVAIDGCLNVGSIVKQESHVNGFGRVFGYLGTGANAIISNSYATNESCIGIEGNNHMGTTITLVSAADILGSAAQTHMPLLNWTDGWLCRDGQIPAPRLDAGSAWRALAVTASQSDIALLAAVYAGKTLYQGDMHAHADKDGKLNETAALNTWKTEMSEHALDFIASLDHKQTNHIENSAWDKDLFLYGTEPGTYISGLTSPIYSATLGQCHYLMVMPDKASLENVLNAFSEFSYNASYTGNCTPAYGAYTYPNFTKARFVSLAQTVKAQGGLFVFAHPTAYEYSSAAEDYFLADGTALEVVYGSLTTRSDGGDGDALCRSYTRRNYEIWKELLAAGHKVWATSGSDIHGPLNDDGNPQVAEKALTSVYAVTDTGSTNKAELITNELARGNFSAGSVGIKMCIGSTPMGGTVDFAGKRLVIEVGTFHQYVSVDQRHYRLDVYTDQGIVYSQFISNRDNAPIALDVDENAMFYRVEIGDANDGRVISYGNPIWND